MQTMRQVALALEEKMNILTKATEIRFQQIKHLQVMIFADQYEMERLEQRQGNKKEIQVRKRTLQRSMEEKNMEIQTLREATRRIEKHPYAHVITGKYWDGTSDEKLAVELCCDISTIRRNRKKLLANMAVYLYDIKE